MVSVLNVPVTTIRTVPVETPRSKIVYRIVSLLRKIMAKALHVSSIIEWIDNGGVEDMIIIKT